MAELPANQSGSSQESGVLKRRKRTKAHRMGDVKTRTCSCQENPLECTTSGEGLKGRGSRGEKSGVKISE